MMDPIAAIGLAGNIVQFVDFPWKILSETRDLYESTTGASADNDVLESISKDLINLNDALTAPSSAGAIPNRLRILAGQCKGVAEELLEVLDKIKVKGSHRKWKSFMQALRSVWKKEQIENLFKRMERLRNGMQLRLPLMLR